MAEGDSTVANDRTRAVGSPRKFRRPPEKIGRYQVERKLGAGGMGIVYLGLDPKLDRPVVLKLLHRVGGSGLSASEHSEWMVREAQAMARVSHSNVVEMFHVGKLGDEVHRHGIRRGQHPA